MQDNGNVESLKHLGIHSKISVFQIGGTMCEIGNTQASQHTGNTHSIEVGVNSTGSSTISWILGPGPQHFSQQQSPDL
jgi:hypothetical protein